MQIDRVLYPIRTLGPGERVAIWTVGCPHKCYKCSNPELWNENSQKDIPVQEFIKYIEKYCKEADGVTITGGDPFYQYNELCLLLQQLRMISVKDILVYTGYDYSYIKNHFANSLCFIDVLIDGAYIDNLNDNTGIRGSSNQNLIVLKSELKKKYQGFDMIPRTRQNFVCNDEIISVGIPNKIE